MEDGKKKQPLSLNQIHSRYLLDLSASQAKPKPRPVDDDAQSTVTVEKKCESTKGSDDDFPRFDFGSPSPPLEGKVNSEEPVSKKLQDSSPYLFAGIADFDSPSSSAHEASESHGSSNTIEVDQGSTETNIMSENRTVDWSHEDIELESSKSSGEEDHVAKKESSFTGEADFDTNAAGGDRTAKVRIEGRRRLCKISKGDDSDAIRDEEPSFDGISDFDSPLQANKTCESTGNEIRDILNDLSSRLEILSIEKKRIPKKVDTTEDLQESVRSKLCNVTIEEGLSVPPVERFESKVGSTIINQHKKEKNYISERKGDKNVGKANINLYKYDALQKSEFMGTHRKLGLAEESSQAYNYRKKEDDFVDLTEPRRVKQVDRRKGKIVEVSDEESDDVTILDDPVDEFILSGPKCSYKLNGKIAKMLFPHQRDGLKWLWSLHCKGKGGILGDDMGLGKTMQMCSFIAGLFHSNLVRRVLIVAPKTLLTHWIKELSTVGLSAKTREYYATCVKTRHYELQYVLQDKGVLLTTYDIVRNNVKSLSGDYNEKDYGEEDEVTWDYIILDEGHLIKNPSTQRAKSLLQLPCRHRIIISGTPLQNDLKELWALFNFCCPELLGDKKEFKEKYENFISRGNEKNASDREKRIGSSVAKELRDCIQPYFLRRMKSEVFQDDTTLSKKSEIIVWLRLTGCQRQLYEAFLKSEIVVSAFDGSPLAALTILKKICDHPLLLTKRAAEDVLEGMDSTMNQEDHRIAEKLAMHIADVADKYDIVKNHEISCKISFILSLLGDLIPKGHNVLIFSQSRKMLDLIQESLTSNHYAYMRIDGTTKIADRAKIVKEFQEGCGAQIFLLTSQVGGLGLTLTNADRVIVADPAWNPSTDNQSVDRAYRIGQKKDVIVYRLMTCSTVEEKIYRKQVFKGGLFRSATEQKEQIRYFSQQDLKDLFSLPKQGFNISLTQQQLLEEHDQQHTMEESLRAHVEFLETLNIAGVSQHSLLFSKAAPVQNVDTEEEVTRPRGSTLMGNTYRRSSVERNVDGSQYAFNPKDVKKLPRNSSPDVNEPSEDEIKERIMRLSQIFANKVAISRLPDKGGRLHKQIDALKLQLDGVRSTKGNKYGDDVIEL